MSERTQPKDIFDAVCHEVGRFFEKQDGFKPTKRKVKWRGNHIRCELAFWSSHSNMAGGYVCFEIVTTVYAIDKRDMDRNGILAVNIPAKDFNVYHIDQQIFSQIITYLKQQIEYVRTLDSKEGFTNFMQTRLPGYCNGEENNCRLLERLTKQN